MLDKVRKRLEALVPIELHKRQEKPLIVAVSGGADSVCLLHLLKKLEVEMKYQLLAIHVEHGIRGEESKQDAQFVWELCNKLKVPCEIVSVDVLGYGKEHGLGDEEAARILRYQVFSEYAKEKSGCIVLAHHMDDNAETMLFQMIRGSGLAGACGMRSLRYDKNGIAYLRPLLGVTRKEIEEYMEAAGLEYRTDSTNLELDYQRNYIRHEVMPKLEKVNSAAVLHLNKTAACMEEVWDYLQEECKKAMPKICCEKDDAIIIDIHSLESYHIAIQKEIVLQVMAHVSGGRKDIASSHVEDVLVLCKNQSGKKVCLPSHVVVVKEYESLRFYKDDVERVAKEIEIDEELLMCCEKTGENIAFELEDGSSLIMRVFPKDSQLKIPKKTYTKWLDYDKIRKGFCIRNRKSGDFFISDTTGHKKKLKSYFIDEKIAVSKRDKMWLLSDGATVLWLIGGRISEHVKVTEETTTIIELNYIGGNDYGSC